MPQIDLLTVTAGDGRALLAAAQAGWSRPVPDCPGWDAADLTGHMGAVLGWIARIVTTGEAVPRSERETPPDAPDALAAWYLDHLDAALGVLTATAPQAPAWTFSSRGEANAGWWRRRLAVELAIHRFDAQRAAGAAPPPVDGDVAAAGVGEFVTEFLPGLLAQPGLEGLAGSLHLHATDAGDCEWWVDLDDKAAVAQPGHRRADTAVRASRSDLLLWLTNRRDPAELSVFGPPGVVSQWTQLRR